MSSPPPEIVGGASVLRWVLIGPPPSVDAGRADGDLAARPASRLAICRYNGEAAFYLFRCDDLWQVVADTWHETLEAAMRQAEREYSGISSSWKPV